MKLKCDEPLSKFAFKFKLRRFNSVAAQVWKLSAADLCEIARTSARPGHSFLVTVIPSFAQVYRSNAVW